MKRHNDVRKSAHLLSRGTAGLFGSCALSVLSFPAAAVAQDVEDGAGMTDIIVTAQRRAERLEDVPAAVVALSPEALEKAGINNLQDLGRITPGFQMDMAGAFQQPAIRGITSTTNGSGNENNVAFYVDGFFVSDTLTLNTDLANIESVQVLKGPQGTLYGRQATGGAILIRTIEPTKEFTGKFQAEYGRFNDRKFAGYVSGPLSEHIRFMASGNHRDSDGWIKLSDPADNRRTKGAATPIKQRSIRTKLQADITGNLTATLAYNYFLTSDGKGLLFTPTAHIGATVPGGNARAVGFYTRSFNGPTLTVAKYNEGTATLEWKTGIGTLTSRTGYRRQRVKIAFDTDGTYVNAAYQAQFQLQTTKQQSLDLVVDAIEGVDLVLGGLYFDDSYGVAPQGNQQFALDAATGGRILRLRNFRELQTKAYAAFADATIRLTDQLSVGLGGRYSVDEKAVQQSSIGVNGGAAVFPTASAEKTFKRFTPRANVRYEIAPRTNIYASYSQGYRSGAFNAASQTTVALANLTIKPEVVNAYEIGFKTAQPGFRFEIAAFYYDDKNQHIALTLPTGGVAGAVSTFTGNVPRAKVKGVDFLFTATPTPNLNVTFGGAWLHARYGRFPNASGVGVDATNSFNISPQTQNLTGQRMPRAPNWSATLSADYTATVGGGELRFSGNAKYTSKHVLNNPSIYGPLAPLQLRDKQRFVQSQYVLVGGEIRWTDPTDHYSVGVFGNNLTNVRYRLSYSGLPSGDIFTPAAPATYGVKAEYRF